MKADDKSSAFFFACIKNLTKISYGSIIFVTIPAEVKRVWSMIMKKVLLFLVMITVLICVISLTSCVSVNSNCKHDNPSRIVILEAKAPTCKSNGLTEGIKCLECGTMVVPQANLEKFECVTFSLQKNNTYTVTGKSSYCDCHDISIPETYQGKIVTSIAETAFLECTTLTSVIIPDSVTSIEMGAFAGCSSLKSIDIPNFVTSIEESTFAGCTSLRNVVIPDNVTNIGYGAFNYCTSLKNITIPESVTSIDAYAFRDCISLVSIDIPDFVTSIGICAFLNCNSLKNVTIGDSLTSIGETVFWGCTSLINIEVSENNVHYKSIDGNVYSKDERTLLQYAIGKQDTSWIIPNFVTSIGDFAFCDSTLLTSIYIPESVTSIGVTAFAGCTSLTSVEIPKSVTSISPWIFSGCTSLESVVIPYSVTSIGDSAFYECSSLTSITYAGTVDQWNAIEIDPYWYYGVPAAEVVCSDGTVPLN